MKQLLWLGLSVALASAALPAAPADVKMIEVSGEGAKYWPRWRGPSGQGQVAAGQYTDKWSPTTSVWKVSVPGRGNSSPIVWGDRLFLTTGYNNGERLSMLAYSRADGKKLWETNIPQNGVEYPHAKNGFASATPATDGQYVYASFGRHGLFAFDFDGKIIWQHKFGIIDNYHGPAGSPVLYQDRIFIYQDANPAPGQGAFVGAFDKKTGKPIWLTPRSENVGWGTAVVITTGERDELIVSSQRRVAAYDPASGKELWSARGMSF
jgi:outer membrane protein assembly factor BamB